MEFKTVLFYVFSAILIIAALRVITARNPVHSALFLVLTFFSAAAIWMLLQAEFLSIVLVLVYVGAVMVLFLFVIMMLDIHIDQVRQGFWKNLWVAIPVGLLIVFELSAVMMRGFMFKEEPVAGVVHMGNTKALGLLIYIEYAYAFEIAAVILLVAIVAAVALTLRRRKDAKYFDPAEAVKVTRAERVRLVSMQAESDRARMNNKK